MKRRDLIKKLTCMGCKLIRNSARHDLYLHTRNGKKQPIPGHDEIDENLAKHIIKELE